MYLFTYYSTFLFTQIKTDELLYLHQIILIATFNTTVTVLNVDKVLR